MKALLFVLIFIFAASLFGQNCDLVTDTETYWPAPPVDKPEYATPSVDATFGTTITRIVGNPGDPIPNLAGYSWPSQQLRHGYSKRQPWNCDESMIYLDRCSPDIWIDGQTYEPLFTREKPSARIRWSYTEPHIMFYITNNGVGRWDVVQDTMKYVVTFSGYSSCTFGDGEGNFTWDDSRVAVLAKRNSDNHLVIFTVDMLNKIKLPDIDMSDDTDIINNCTISPRGTFIAVVGEFASTDGKRDRLQVRLAVDTLGKNYGDVVWEETLYGVPSHFDTQIDQNGDEVIAGIAKSNPPFKQIKGKIIKRKLLDGEITLICDYKYPSHTSGRNYKKPGWVFVTYQNRNESYPPYLNELVAVKLDGSVTERISHLYSNKVQYEFESHGVPSPLGNRVMWASDWDANTWPVQSYVADFRNGVYCERYNLKTDIVGNGSLNVSDSMAVISGSKIRLEAKPAAGWEFARWSGDLSGADNPAYVLMDSDKNIEAVFEEIQNGGNDSLIVVQVSQSSDDAEERKDGSVSTSSSDLEFVYDGSDAGRQTVGIRFNDITIPQDATIESAAIEFTAKDNQDGDITLTIKGEAADNAATFSSATNNITTRSLTQAEVTWAPQAWISGNTYQTPDLKSIVQEIVDRDGWVSGNSLSFIVTGNSDYKRRAYSYDGKSTAAVVLHIEYSAATAITRHNENIPAAYLLRNYPNPFNPFTTIAYFLPQTDYVRISIYDLLGRKIATLVDNEYQPAGNYTIQWHADDSYGNKLPSGMYLARIKAGGFQKTIKLLLVR